MCSPNNTCPHKHKMLTRQCCSQTQNADSPSVQKIDTYTGYNIYHITNQLEFLLVDINANKHVKC